MPYAMKTKYDLAVWQHKDGETYAFPLGVPDSDGFDIVPGISSLEWNFKCVLPKGMEVTNVKTVTGHRVKCTLGGANGVNTWDKAYS
jgi:hypothetical protein